MNLRRRTALASLTASLLFGAPVWASGDKYCRAEAPGYDVHIFGYTFKGENAKRQMGQGLNELYKKFEPGARIKVYAHNATGHYLALNQCLPGCPQQGFLGQLFDSSCSAEVAKRDRLAFNKRFAEATLAGVNSGGDKYDIFLAIQNLSDAYKGQRHSGTVVAAISMLPDGVNPADPASFDAFYVQQVPKLKIALDFPPVYTIGASPSGEVMKFWKEVFAMKKVDFQMKPLN